MLADQGNIEAAAQFQRAADTLKAAFTKADKQPKDKIGPELKDFLDEQRAQVAALKETHALQVQLEQDSEDGTAAKYAKIKALDDAYLLQIGSIYGFESAEYDAMLKEMEQHHKESLAARLKDENEYKSEIYAMQREMDAEEKSRQNKLEAEKKADVKRVVGDVTKITQDMVTLAFTKGATIGSIATGVGDQIMKGLGDIMMRQGEAYLTQSQVMISLVPLLFHPVTAGEGALGIGLALIALGAALGAIGSGGGGGGGGGGGPVGSPSPLNFSSALALGPNTASTSGALNPVVPVAVTVIGPNDPQAQRQIVQLITNAQRRNIG